MPEIFCGDKCDMLSTANASAFLYQLKIPAAGRQRGRETRKGSDYSAAMVFAAVRPETEGVSIAERFIRTEENENGLVQSISFQNENSFNFAFDILDALGREKPDKLALLYVAEDGTDRRFSFKEMKDASSQTANYFTSLGIRRGDRVMLVLGHHYQFWFSMLALNKIGAIAIPATTQLLEHDFSYRFKTAGVSAIVCTARGDAARQADIVTPVLLLQAFNPYSEARLSIPEKLR